MPMVALSGTESCPYPSPKYSTKAPTTFFSLSRSVTVRTRSVGVTPSRRVPVNFTPRTFGMGMWYGSPSITASASMPPTPHPRTPRPLTMVV